MRDPSINPRGEIAPPNPLRGKSVLITGGAQRIGRAIGLAMAEAGADVAITFLTSKGAAQQTVVEIAGCGVRSLALQCDVREEKSILAAVKEVTREFGGIDVLINNAAIYETIEIDQITPEQWGDMFATNNRGPFLFSRACAAELRKRRGRIINLGSLGGLCPWTSHAHYCASKAALHLQTQILAKAWAPKIAVNCVAPGLIDLQNIDLRNKDLRKKEKKPSAFMRKMAAKTPMGRNGTAADVVAAALFFASAPHFITGQILFVDGGLALV
jgi:NAD(P)-dependent dehydrogenase (short-subunit alcohol dehydrogenase family)